MSLSVDNIFHRCEDTGRAPMSPASEAIVTVTPLPAGEPIEIGRAEPKGDVATVSGSFDLPEGLAEGPIMLAVTATSGDLFRAELPLTITGESTNG